MLANIAGSQSINYVLRGLQTILAVATLGAGGYAVHSFHGHSVDEHFEFGDFTDYVGVPNAWGFLLFCAAWTILGVIFLLFTGVRLAGHRLIGYARVAVESIALLSWLAGFIAVAVSIGSNGCPAEESGGCGAITAATVFGALEWLLFVATTVLTVKLVFDRPRSAQTSMTMSEPKSLSAGPNMPV
ncbi:hypothetical protein Sste5346_009683 [Sporothrix stenoceras]|uniref:MARVEL domain-containing protein n=1 Tax=Sporothrix stenoceras TaxID=5173 RepID=A0ABR3YJ01_9PEZI